MPQGWNISFQLGDDERVASILFDSGIKKASVKLDKKIFTDPNIPEGCKVFAMFHEMGHLIHGPAEHKCDEFAFYHALRAGVTPFMCYVALRAFMPEHYNYRIVELGNKLLQNEQLKNDV